MKTNPEDIFDASIRGAIAPKEVSFDGIYGQEVPGTPKDVDAAIAALRTALEEYRAANFLDRAA